MKFRVHIFVRKTSMFLLPVHSTAKPNEAIWQKRVAFGLMKSNKITISTAEEVATEAPKALPSIQSIYLSQNDEIVELSFVEVAPYIQEILDTHYVKRFNANGVCFLEFYRPSNNLELFHV